MTPVLVIGYGNELRGDDGVGPHVVRQLAALGLDGVHTRIVHQLLPELAAELADTDCAIFVDAQVGSGTPHLSAIGRAGGARCGGHAADPQGLLDLTHAVYGRAPQAWLMAVPVESFRLDQSLSQAASASAAVACRMIADWIKAQPRP
jgi:hydrogenase maturation protease